MRILLDENLPADLALLLAGHDVDTVTKAGWSGVQNGKLLQLADQNYEAFLTMDRNIEHQQNLAIRKVRIIVLRAPSNRIAHLAPLVPMIIETLRKIKPGQLRSIGA